MLDGADPKTIPCGSGVCFCACEFVIESIKTKANKGVIIRFIKVITHIVLIRLNISAELLGNNFVK